ncbi:MAG: hydrogen peroxide-dependent heme synthase [Actinomycetota bacterium]
MTKVEPATYVSFPVFRRLPHAFGEGGIDVEEAVQEWEVLFKEFADRVTVRGVYSAAGFRPDADLLLWWIGEAPDVLQEFLVRLRRTALGAALEQTWAFVGVHRPPEFNPQHVPAFLRGAEPEKYLCVYPFVRTAEWYLLPEEERGGLLRIHGEIGREFPDVLPNTTSAFGLGDWEWILAFEAERLERIVDCIRRLRAAEARRYTKVEVPFVVGIRKELGDAVGDLA